MVRFITDDAAADEAALRAARGKHLVIFEDGDQGPALRAKTPWLSWSEIDGLQALPYGEFADFTLRYTPSDESDNAWRNDKFHLKQITVVPLSRMWQLVLPGLGLSSVEPGAASTLTRKALRRKVAWEVEKLDEAERASLVPNQPGDWMDRIAVTAADAQRMPWTVHSRWLEHLDWGMLAPDGSFSTAAELLWLCSDAHGDEAYSHGEALRSATRAALQGLAEAVRNELNDGSLAGYDLASEVATAPAYSGYARSSISSTTPWSATIAGGTSRRCRMIGWSGPKTEPETSVGRSE